MTSRERVTPGHLSGQVWVCLAMVWLAVALLPCESEEEGSSQRRGLRDLEISKWYLSLRFKNEVKIVEGPFDIPVSGNFSILRFLK